MGVFLVNGACRRSKGVVVVLCRRFSGTSAASASALGGPKVAWFYATDIPKSKPEYFDWKPTKAASKYHVFSDEDSSRLEAGYQRMILDRKRRRESQLSSADLELDLDVVRDADDDEIDVESFVKLSTPILRPSAYAPIPVKEDGLFQVDLDKREVRPCYWDGPVYDVRRGTWFYSGSKLLPCPERLADELEQLYQKELVRLKRESKSAKSGDNDEKEKEKTDRNRYAIHSEQDEDIDAVKFSDENPEIVYGYKSLSTSVFQKIIPSLAGSKKIVRGYKVKKADEDESKVLKSESSSGSTEGTSAVLSPLAAAMANSTTSSDTMSKLEDIFMPFSHKSSETKMEEQMKNDYDEIEKEQNIPIDHLVLCIHGIGQKLSQKVDSVNFVHDINIFRKLTKSIQYGEATNASSPITGDEEISEKEHEIEKEKEKEKRGTQNDSTTTTSTSTTSTTTTTTPSSHRIQVLPVLWRHDMTFGRKIHPNQKEFVTVQDINVEGVPAVRTLFSDVVADFLLYSEPSHKKQMLEIVTYQLNRIYREFCKRNPIFAKNPKVSVVAHSLGSVIGYEALRAAAKVGKERKQQTSNASVRTSSSEKYSSLPPAPPSSTYLEFPVSNFITLGSPLGLFLLISGRSIEPEELNIGTMYNLFHPSDPISYRVEPLITQVASNLKPVPIPYTKGGLTSQIQELSELGSKISQSASLMWSNITSTLTKSDILEQIQQTDKEEAAAAAAIAAAEAKNESEKSETTDTKETATTQTSQPPSLTQKQIENIHRKLQQLNPNGRLDYVLQEGLLDISILQAIASHVSYFENADIANFVLQILYKQGK